MFYKYTIYISYVPNSNDRTKEGIFCLWKGIKSKLSLQLSKIIFSKLFLECVQVMQNGQNVITQTNIASIRNSLNGCLASINPNWSQHAFYTITPKLHACNLFPCFQTFASPFKTTSVHHHNTDFKCIVTTNSKTIGIGSFPIPEPIETYLGIFMSFDIYIYISKLTSTIFGFESFMILFFGLV